MDILGQDVEAYFRGVLDVYQDGDGYRLKRVTDAQTAHYEACNDRWPLRAHCNAGATLVLKTNSKILDVSFSVVMGARQYLGLDVEVDGAVLRSVYIKDFDRPAEITITNNAQGLAHVIAQGDGAFTVRLFAFEDQKERTVCVYLPQSVELSFTAVTVDDDASVTPVQQPERNVLCLGDSITQGMDSLSPMTAYTTQLARLLDAELLNQGVGGHIFDVASFDSSLSYDADWVTIAYGTNDWNGNKTVVDIQKNVRDYLEAVTARYPSIPVYVLSPIWRVIGNEARNGGTLWDFSRVILETANAFTNVMCVDGLTLMPHQEHLLPDGTHPNDEGFLHYALNLYRAIEK